MPDDVQFLKQDKLLSFEEITRVSSVFLKLGVKKIRLTGGEPLLRKNICQLVRQIKSISLKFDLAMTTNGYLLEKFSEELKNSGLNRVTVSLDTLDAAKYKLFNGNKGNLLRVLSGIDVAMRQDFDEVKINCVVIRNKNLKDVLDLVSYFKNKRVTLRFIEYMDAGNANHWGSSEVVSQSELIDLISRKYEIKKNTAKYFGEVSQNYELVGEKIKLGFISSVSKPFCSSCTRLRLSSEGKLYKCLFASSGFDLREKIRMGFSDLKLERIIRELWAHRSDQYSANRQTLINLKSSRDNKKIEMQYIGG